MNDFAAAYAPDTFTVLGKRLEDFSIGHALWLQRLGCDPVDSYDKLITAVLVCSRPPDDIRATLDDRWLRLKVWVWGRRLGEFDIEEKIQLFRDYVAANSLGPEVFAEDEGGSIPGAPWLQHVRTTLISKGWPVDYVERASYGLVLWDYYTHWENEGRAEIVGIEHLAIKNWANANHDEILRKAAAACQAEGEG